LEAKTGESASASLVETARHHRGWDSESASSSSEEFTDDKTPAERKDKYDTLSNEERNAADRKKEENRPGDKGASHVGASENNVQVPLESTPGYSIPPGYESGKGPDRSVLSRVFGGKSSSDGFDPARADLGNMRSGDVPNTLFTDTKVGGSVCNKPFLGG